MTFTEEQIQAIKTWDKPIMVLATAGSGKTAVLAERIKYGIRELKIDPMNILAITFTNKATDQMRRKIQNNLVTVNTIHSLCCEILREDIDLLERGYNKDFEIIDTADCLDILKLVMNGKNIVSNHSYKFILESISNWINLQTEPNIEVKKIIKYYFEHLEKFNLLTFDTILLVTKELLENPFLRMKYEFKYRYILVDEFQDVNLIQYEIIKLLASVNKNIFIVGDDDQTIYSFRGSYKKVFQDYENDFNPEKIYLEKNWRSNDKICNFANKLINFNINRIQKKIYSDYIFNGQAIEIKEFNNSSDEVSWVVERLKNLISDFKYKDFKNPPFAVLYRNNFIAKEFELALMKEKIKYKICGGIHFSKRKEIQDLVSYLKLIIDNNSFLSFKRICNVPSRGIGDTSVKRIQNYMMANDITLLEAINCPELTKKSYEKVIDFWNKITNLSNKFEEMNLYDLLNEIITIFNYDVSSDEDRSLNILEFMQMIKKLDYEIFVGNLEKKETLIRFLDDFTLSDGTKTDDKDVYVQLSTIHSVKGLEFDQVFFVGLEDQFCPLTYNREITMEELEEERRIAFVGFTRARYRLYLSHCKNRFYYGKYVKCFESRFINEAIF